MPHRLTPLAAALLLSMLAPVSSSALAAPAVAHWTVTDLGTLGGAYSYGYGINNAGQVTGNASTGSNSHAFLYSNGAMTDLGTLGGVISYGFGINNAGQVTGYSFTAGNLTDHAFLYSNGVMTDLGTLGGGYSEGYAINNAGQVTGWAQIANGSSHAFLYSNGAMTDLGTLGGFRSDGYGINDFGQVTGKAQAANTAERAFLYSNGVMIDLGTLGGISSEGYAINNAGQVTGKAQIANGAEHAFIYSNGSMTDLGALGGGYSEGYAINNAGLVAGTATTAGNAAQHAILYSQGKMQDINSFNGVAGSGLSLNEARGINDVGQIVSNGSGPTGPYTVFLTLDTTVWEYGYSGSWDGAYGWSHGIGPNQNTHAIIDPIRSLTVYGPTGNATIQQLSIGGDATGNNGIATLRLDGGTLDVLGNAGIFTTISNKGVLTGDGRLNGAVLNLGTVTAQNLTLTGGLTNFGRVGGNGRLNAELYNAEGGITRANNGERLELTGSGHSNSGTFDIDGGEIQISGGLANNLGGRILLNDGRLAVYDGISNSGQMQVTFGESDIFGAITTHSGGKIILSGNSNTTFYDAVDVQGDGELRISIGSTGVFFGQVYQRTDSMFTGGGAKFYEGGLSVGDSPGSGFDGGDVTFGAGNTYLAEIGGTVAGSGFDFYAVSGSLTLGGTLKLVSWAGFTGQVGQNFDLFDWGTLSGTFDNIDSSGMLLASGATLDTHRLYIDGTISVTAVPEPETWAMLLAGLGLVGWTVQRRKL